MLKGQLRSPALKMGRAGGSGQADPGVRNRVGRMGGGTIGDEDLRSRGHWYRWDQNSLGMGPLLDAVSLDNLGQRFATGKKYTRSWQAHARARAFVCFAFSTTL